MPDLGSIGLDLPSSDAALCYELYPSPQTVGAFVFACERLLPPVPRPALTSRCQRGLAQGTVQRSSGRTCVASSLTKKGPLLSLLSTASSTSSACLATLRAAALAALRPHTAGHTWHIDALVEGLHPRTTTEPPWRRARHAAAPAPPDKQPFTTPPNSADGGPCLWGRLTFGDAVDDEWWAVWLLRGLTAALPPGTAARAWDEDGDFVLIEAAEALPKWVRPETAADRVWFCGGALHLVPPPATSATSSTTARSRLPPGAPVQPTAAQALAFVRDPAAPTEASAKVVAALAPRLEGAPARAARSGHTARLTVPAALAGVLAGEPRLLAAATAAYVGATPRARAAAAAAAASSSAGLFDTAAFATVAARFSRLQYAQFALAPAGPAPPGWPTLPGDAPKVAVAALELGLKASAAFRLLVAGGEALSAPPSLPADPARLACLPEWRAYLAALTARGAFDGEVEGSARWRGIMDAAAREFAGSAAWAAAAAARAAPGLRVRALLAAGGPPPDAPALEAASASVPIDSDAWMADGGAALEAEVEALEKGAAAAAAAKAARRGGGVGSGAASAPPPHSSTASPFDPAAVVSQVQAFVNKISSFEGAEVPAAAAAPAAPQAEVGEEEAGGGAGGGQPGAASGLALDGADFWRELGACLGVAPDALFSGDGAGAAAINGLFGSDMDDEDEDGGASSSEEGSSFYGEEEGEEEDDEEPSSSDDDGAGGGAGAVPLRPPRSTKAAVAAVLASERARLAALEAGGRSVRAGPPPLAEGGGGERPPPRHTPFAAAYASALDAQLAGTTLAATYSEAAAGPSTSAAPGPVVPVDVDANLVSSLLASHAGGREAGGGARFALGPAAGLAAMLGVRLPAGPAPPAPAAQAPAPAAPGMALPPATPNSSRG